jgi:hypothetical protein
MAINNIQASQATAAPKAAGPATPGSIGITHPLLLSIVSFVKNDLMNVHREKDNYTIGSLPQQPKTTAVAAPKMQFVMLDNVGQQRFNSADQRQSIESKDVLGLINLCQESGVFECLRT